MSKQNALENFQFVKDWFNTRSISKVNLEQVERPSSDPSYELTILGEIKFQPQNSDELYAEIWFADNGAIGFGIELQQRIAALLGISSRSKRFAGGKEPSLMSKEALCALLTLIADGRIAISAVCLPLFGLVTTKLVIGENERHYSKLLGLRVLIHIFPFELIPSQRC